MYKILFRSIFLFAVILLLPLAAGCGSTEDKDGDTHEVYSHKYSAKQNGLYNINFSYTGVGFGKIYINDEPITGSYYFSSGKNTLTATQDIKVYFKKGKNKINIRSDAAYDKTDFEVESVNIEFNKEFDKPDALFSIPCVLDAAKAIPGDSHKTRVENIDNKEITVLEKDNQYVSYYLFSDGYKDIDISFNVSSLDYKARLKLEINDKKIKNYTLNKTGKMDKYNMISAQNIKVGPGIHELKFTSVLRKEGVIGLGEVKIDMKKSLAGAKASNGNFIVYDASILDYGVVPDTDADLTEEFQTALNEISEKGGGVLYVPEGKYRIEGNLKLPVSVSIEGDWLSPDEGGLGKGTILMAYAGRGKDSGTPFISAALNCAVKNISIWYPEQSFDNIVPYPYTIQGSERQGYLTVMNVTLYNSYNGLKLGQGKIFNGCNLYRNIYATPLSTGMWQNNTADVPRFENIYFSPKYWMESGLEGAPKSSSDKEQFVNYMRSNAVAMNMHRLDWGYFYNIYAEDVHTGIEFNDSNSAIAYLKTRNVNKGIKINRISYPGLQIAYSSIYASVGENPKCLVFNGFDSDPSKVNVIIQISKTEFGGDPDICIELNARRGARPVLNLYDSSFKSWKADSGNYAIAVNRGSLMIQDCEFSKMKNQVYLSDKVNSAIIRGNKNMLQEEIKVPSGVKLIYGEKAVDIPEMPQYNHIFAPEPMPGNTDNFYNVMLEPFNAYADVEHDDTIAIQKALNNASAEGGGVVYLPAGKYRIDTSLVVPEGVELRGSFAAQHHGSAMNGTIIMAYGGKGKADGEPLISLETRAGISGIAFYYPEQELKEGKFAEYPWSIRGNIESWITDVCFVNTYRGIDMMSNDCSMHILDGIHGLALDIGVQAGNGIDGGWMQNVHFNPSNWTFSKYPRPGTEELHQYCLDATTGFLFGSCKNYNTLHNFQILIKYGIKFVDDKKGGFDGVIYGWGLDVNEFGIHVDEVKKLDIIQLMDVSLEGPVAANVYTTESFDGVVNLFNCNAWGPGMRTCEIKGGTVNLVQYTAWHAKDGRINDGGALNAYGCTFVRDTYPRSAKDFTYEAGSSGKIEGCLGRFNVNVEVKGGKVDLIDNSGY